MVKSYENVAPFLLKCHEMVEDESMDSLISWNQSENTFIIWDAAKFSSELLPRYFKHSNFSSFVRQLNIYGFHKTETERWEFANVNFVKGQKHLLKNIVRRKNCGVGQKKASEITTFEEENKELQLWKEVENLKTDKNVLTEELIKLRQHQKNSEGKLVLLREQLKGMEKHQQQMLSFIVMAMQTPSFLVQFFQPNRRMTENNILSEIIEDDVPSDGAIVTYHPPTHECTEPESCSDPQKPLDLELSSEEVKDLFSNVDFFSGLMDEKMLSFESSVPLTLPDMPGDDDMLEQLLLSSPITEDNEDDEGHTHAGIEADYVALVGSEELYPSSQMEISLTGARPDNPTNLDRLTEKMEHTKF